MSTVCKACGAPVRWETTQAGKKIPLNPDPVLGGNLEMGEDGRMHLRAASPDVALYVTHFVTCPNASTYRRTR